jgi:Mg2+ and Co2+ transporter CorA
VPDPRLEEIANDLAQLTSRLDDLVLEALREQVRGEMATTAKEYERQLTRIRRALAKAEHIARELSNG